MELRSWDEVVARLDAKEARHAARPWPLRRTIDAYRWVQHTWYRTWHPNPFRRAKWRWQRSKRGWADCDTWGLDHYLARVISESVTALRDHLHGYPDGMTFEEWKAVLTRIAEPLAVDWNRVIDGEDVHAGLDREAAELAAQQDALRLLAEHFPALWD